jgi:multidrug efflux pump
MKQFRDVGSSFDGIGKQQLVQVDRDAAARLGVSMGQIDSVLYNAFGQNQVSTIYSDINQYRVVLTADSGRTPSPQGLLDTYVRSSQGKMIPLSALATIQPHLAPVTVNHFDQLESASIGYNLAKGITQADGLKLVDQAIFAAHLPPGVQKKYTGDNQNLVDTLNNALLMLLAVILVMYVVLGVLYESLIHPLTILSTLPAAGMGAFLAMLVTHTQLTLMSIIAVLMLIGIVKKNAILMVDFALVAEREHGMSPPEAIREAALVRFRPITMTTLVAMGAALPLAIGFGYGSELRQPAGHRDPRRPAGVSAADPAEHAGDLPVAARPARTQGGAAPAACRDPAPARAATADAGAAEIAGEPPLPSGMEGTSGTYARARRMA